MVLLMLTPDHVKTQGGRCGFRDPMLLSAQGNGVYTPRLHARRLRSRVCSGEDPDPTRWTPDPEGLGGTSVYQVGLYERMYVRWL